MSTSDLVITAGSAIVSTQLPFLLVYCLSRIANWLFPTVTDDRN